MLPHGLATLGGDGMPSALSRYQVRNRQGGRHRRFADGPAHGSLGAHSLCPSPPKPSARSRQPRKAAEGSLDGAPAHTGPNCPFSIMVLCGTAMMSIASSPTR